MIGTTKMTMVGKTLTKTRKNKNYWMYHYNVSMYVSEHAMFFKRIILK